MSELIADLEHPLVEIASRMMRPDGRGSWTFEQQDAAILEAAIVQEKHDPHLASALLGLFQVADELHQQHGATEAAGVLLAVLGRVGPHLSLRSGTAEAVTDALERAKAGMASLTGERPRAPAAEPPRSEDAIPASELIQNASRRIRS